MKSAALNAITSSESNEWYTPARYIEAAREVLGGIELDPASCAEAQETVKADRYFTLSKVSTGNDARDNLTAVQCDGLTTPWVARSAFVNSPYGTRDGKSNQLLWSRKLVAAYEQRYLLQVEPEAEYFDEVADNNVGAVHSAILLVNACTSEKWFTPLWKFPICFTDHRIKYDFPKIRRYAAWQVGGRDRHAYRLRRELSRKALRVWSNKRAAWFNNVTDLWTTDVNEASVYTLPPATQVNSFVRLFGELSDIAFDRADVPAQPTKGSAFVYFGSEPLLFAERFQQFGPVVQWAPAEFWIRQRDQALREARPAA